MNEFVELAREYLLQETVAPAKKLWHFAGYSLAAAAIWSAALVLLSIAGLRALMGVLPRGPYWESLGYVMFAVALVGLIALLMKVIPDRGVHDVANQEHQVGDPS